jgi:hypothetical protein
MADGLITFGLPAYLQAVDETKQHKNKENKNE